MMNGGKGGGVRTDGGEGVVLLGLRGPWVQDHCQPCALAIHWGAGRGCPVLGHKWGAFSWALSGLG